MRKELRRCIHCHVINDRRLMLRVTRTPQGELLVDPPATIHGRSAYLCRLPSCCYQSQKYRKLNKALRFGIDESLWTEIGRHLPHPEKSVAGSVKQNKTGI